MGFVATLRSGTYSILETYRAANPALLAHAHTSRPESMGDVPAAFVGEISAPLAHDSGTRRWGPCSVQVIVVDNIAINAEADARLDGLTEELIDAFSDAPHAYGPNTVGEPVLAGSTEVDVNGVLYAGRLLTIGQIWFTEGR